MDKETLQPAVATETTAAAKEALSEPIPSNNHSAVATATDVAKDKHVVANSPTSATVEIVLAEQTEKTAAVIVTEVSPSTSPPVVAIFNQEDQIIHDPISESYRSIVEVINRTSKGFKEGKKWKCVNSGGGQNNNNPQAQQESAITSLSQFINQTSHSSSSTSSRRQKLKMSHSHTVDERSLKHSLDHGEFKQRSAKGRSRLVRQKATNMDDSDEQLLPNSTSSNALVTAVHIDETTTNGGYASSRTRPATMHLHVQRGLPARQWTVDTCTGLKTPMQSQQQQQESNNGGGSTAYLLRPVSRNSLMSSSGAMDSNIDASARRLSPGDRPRSSAGRSPMRERMRIGDIANKSNASSFNQSCDAGAGSLSSSSRVAVSGRIYERALQPHLQPGPHSARRAQLRKQRTSESAPHQSGAGPGAVGSNVPGFGGSSRHLPRQQSNASAYSAVIPTSYSHQGITLVRGASCSLVDIPTYLGPSAGVELGLMCDHAPNSTTAAAGLPPTLQTKPGGSGMSHLGHSISSTDGHRSKRERPRLQLDLTRKKNAKSARKTQWTVLCVSLTLLTLAVTLVGTMLSVGSQYQERVISRQWHEITKNHTRGVKKKTAVTLVEEEELEEPFVIVPNDLAGDIDEESGTGYGKNNSTAGDKPEGGKSEGGRKEEKEIIPILFPETADTRDLFGIDNDRPVVVVKRRRRKKRTGIAIP